MKNRILALGFSILLISIYMSLSVFQFFIRLRVPVMTPSFGDLRLITSTVDCFKKDPDWSLNSASCDPWMRPFNLPSIWVRIFSFFHLSENMTNFIGFIFMVLFCTAAYYWILQYLNAYSTYGNAQLAGLGIIFLFFVSPPVLLLLERGNVDVLIFVGVTFSTYLLRKSKFLSMLLITFLGALKLFPWAALLAIIRVKLSKLSIVTLALTLVLFGFSLVKELNIIRDRSTTDFNVISFGISIVPKFVISKIDPAAFANLEQLLGFSVFLMLFLAIKFHTARSLNSVFQSVQNSLKSDTALGDAFVVSSLVFLGSYLVGTSYDYRLVFIIPLLVILLILPVSQMYLFIISTVGLIVLYDSYWFSPLIGIFSDLVLMVFAPLVALLMFEILKSNLKQSRYRQ